MLTHVVPAEVLKLADSICCSCLVASARVRSPLLVSGHLCLRPVASACVWLPLLMSGRLCSRPVASARVRSPLLTSGRLCSRPAASARVRSPMPGRHLSVSEEPTKTVPRPPTLFGAQCVSYWLACSVGALMCTWRLLLYGCAGLINCLGPFLR